MVGYAFVDEWIHLMSRLYDAYKQPLLLETRFT